MLAARKESSDNAPFMGLVYSDALKLAKNDGNRAPTDQDTTVAIYAMLKNLNAVLSGDPGKNVPPLPPGSEYAQTVIAQRNLLLTFVPAPLEGEELETAVSEAAASAGVAMDMKAMGAVMRRLNELYPGRIDGAQVKTILLSGAR